MTDFFKVCKALGRIKIGRIVDFAEMRALEMKEEGRSVISSQTDGET